MIFVNNYGFVSVFNFLMISEKHSYLQLSIKLAIWSLILNLNTSDVNNSIRVVLLFISSYKLLLNDLPNMAVYTRAGKVRQP